MTFKELIEKYHQNTITESEKLELQQILKKAYYEGFPIIGDAQYDTMFNTSTESIGYNLTESNWPIIQHTYHMGSLAKLKTYEAAVKWLQDKTDYIIEPKLDGLSICFYYENNKVTSAILRGDGIQGENILVNASKFIGFKEILLNTNIVAVRGEIVITASDFEKIKDQYSNRRNAVAGICRRQDGQFSDLLTFYAYDVQYANRKLDYTEIEAMTDLYNEGFKVPFVYKTLTEDFYLSAADIRTSSEEYQMDGLVIKLNRLDEQDALGYKDNRPLGQIALKFPPEGVETTLLGYEWNVGSTGAVIPTALLETVDLQGSKISRAAMGSCQAVQQMNAGINSRVIVRKMGDVIPKITEVIQKGDDPIVPSVCPDCGSALVIEGANLFCKNELCPQKIIASCNSFMNALKIKGIGSALIKDLVSNNVLTHYSQIIQLTPEIISSNSKMSLARATKLVDSIKKALENLDMKNFMTLFCINGVSATSIYSLYEHCEHNIQMMLHIDFEHCKQIMGQSKATSYISFVTKNIAYIEAILSYKISLNS